MEQTAAPPQLPPLSAAGGAIPATAVAATHPDSVDSSPRSRHTDSWDGDNSLYPSNNGSTAAPVSAPVSAPGGLTKLRLMCSSGGHIVPRPHDKSLCYVGGDTRIVVVDRHTTLSDLTHRLAKTLLRSSAASTPASFTLKYQLPSEDLDSLISVTTDEDLENMIDEYERLNSSSDVNKSSRLRLFLFPTKPESVSSIGSLLESSIKSEDWFLNALNGSTSGFSDSSSVNCLLGLEDDVPVPEKKDVINKGVIGKNLRGNGSVQDVQSVPDSPMLETTSSFGSASSSPSLANLPPIRVNADDQQKVVGGIEEQFFQMSVHQQHHLKQQEDGAFLAPPAPAVIAGVPVNSKEYPNRVLSEDARSEQGFQIAYLKQQQQQQQQQQQYQQKQFTGFDLVSPDSVSSDGSITNPLSRRKPPVIYQDPVPQTQPSSNNNNQPSNPNNIPDQNPRIQQQQQQQIQDSAYLIPTPTTQIDPQHPQLQFIQPQYVHPSYYPMYPSQTQHNAHPPLSQQNFVYYMPTRQPPQGYTLQQQQQQAATKTESPASVYRTTNSGAPVTQFVQVPSSQQYNGNYTYEFSDQSQGQHVYYAAQPMPPQSAAQYQTMTSTLPVEAGLHVLADNNNNSNMKQQQQVRTLQP